MSLLVNRPEDVQEMRAKGLVVSVFDDRETLAFFKALAPHLSVGCRYYEVFQCLQEYRQERWLWIAVHRFLYNNIKTIATVFSIVGVLAGLFKTILSLKQPDGPCDGRLIQGCLVEWFGEFSIPFSRNPL